MFDTHSPALSQDVAFDLLSNARRRFVLRRLQESSEPIELGDLAADLAAKENGIPPEELSPQQRKRTYVSLYQTHVPKLADAGVITYDPDAGTVAGTNSVEELSGYFQSSRDPPPWEVLYTVFAGLGLLAYLSVAAVDVAVLDWFTLGVAVLLGVLLLSGVHYAHRTVRANTVSIPVEGR